MTVIDTHCHLDLVEQKGLNLTEVLSRATNAGIEAIIQIATDAQSSRWNRNLVHSPKEDSAPELFYTVGLHPEAVDEFTDLSEIESLIEEFQNDDACVAIGECGLDYFHSPEKADLQKRAFERQMEGALRYRMPLILHLRDERSYHPDRIAAMKDASEMILEHEDLRGVLHCYTYSYREALPFVDRGWMVSFSGIVTYKNAEIVKEAAERLPLECLMVETDAPYLSPVPHRGKTNEPAHTRDTLEFLVALRSEKDGKAPEEIRRTILENARSFTGWKKNARS